jgi:hypothetical protein
MVDVKSLKLISELSLKPYSYFDHLKSNRNNQLTDIGEDQVRKLATFD